MQACACMFVMFESYDTRHRRSKFHFISQQWRQQPNQQIWKLECSVSRLFAHRSQLRNSQIFLQATETFIRTKRGDDISCGPTFDFSLKADFVGFAAPISRVDQTIHAVTGAFLESVDPQRRVQRAHLVRKGCIRVVQQRRVEPCLFHTFFDLICV